MPNNIINTVTFGADSAARKAFQKMLRDVQAEDEPLGSFDFNKLLPMHEELNIEAGGRTMRGLNLVREYKNALESLERQKSTMSADDYETKLRECEDLYMEKRLANPKIWELGEKAYSNTKLFGSPTWYEWCNRNWGTKWNAYEPRPLREDSDTMVFYTAWNSVPKIINALSRKYPDQTITYCWADEDIGHNVGEIAVRYGKILDENIPKDGSREAYEMAAGIMETPLSDYGLYLTEDGESYEYRDAGI